jgi:hypothetical protein
MAISGKSPSLAGASFADVPSIALHHDPAVTK